MNWFTGVVVYLCIWWVVIFCTLPLWIERDDSENPEEIGPGAPKDPKIKKKFILTSIISAIIFLMVYILIDIEIVNFREIAELMIKEDYN
jgi:predicted secreted protein